MYNLQQRSYVVYATKAFSEFGFFGMLEIVKPKRELICNELQKQLIIINSNL